MAKVYVVIYTSYYHIYKLALEVQKGLQEAGVEVKLFQVAETLPQEVQTKMHMPAKPDIPVITAEQLAEPDGLIFGFPTRFGTMPAQFKALLDATGSLWSSGALRGKFGGLFTSTGTQHGGQETTLLTAITYFAHQGIIYVPIGYSNPTLFDVTTVNGSSPYGAGVIAGGDGSRQPSEAELEVGKTQGLNFGNIVKAYVAGKQ